MKKTFAAAVSLCLVLILSTVAFSADSATAYTFKTNIEEWDKVNSDVEGWLYVEGTNVNYPVIFYPDDTFYYVSRGYDKQASRNGVIYAEGSTKSGPLSEMSLNTVLYGHNWTNVSANPRIATATDVMFAQLPAFHHFDFASKHQFINYSNLDGAYVFQVFAAFYSEIDFLYYRPNPTSEEFDEIMTGVRARSLHNYPVDVSYGDYIITLSTCTRAFGPSDKQRFVVMGKMVPAGTEKVTITSNPNYQKPSL